MSCAMNIYHGFSNYRVKLTKVHGFGETINERRDKSWTLNGIKYTEKVTFLGTNILRPLWPLDFRLLRKLETCRLIVEDSGLKNERRVVLFITGRLSRTWSTFFIRSGIFPRELYPWFRTTQLASYWPHFSSYFLHPPAFYFRQFYLEEGVNISVYSRPIYFTCHLI